MNRIVENKLTFDYIASIIKISTQRMDQESNVSFQDESREIKWKISCYPEISFSSETNFENESINKRVKYFSPLKKKRNQKNLENKKWKIPFNFLSA